MGGDYNGVCAEFLLSIDNIVKGNDELGKGNDEQVYYYKAFNYRHQCRCFV